VFVVAAVRLMADRTRLSKSRLMKMRFLELFGLVGMAGETGADWIGLQEAGSLAGMGIVAGDAFSLGSGMRYLGLVDVLHLIAVAGGAERSRVGVGQDDFAVLGGRVTDFAGLFGKGRMRKLSHQLRLRGLMRVMTLGAGGGGKRLSLVSLDERGIFDVVAVDAESGDGLVQMIVEFLLAFFADFVSRVASVASHVERGVAAAFGGNIRSLTVAIEAEVLAFFSGSGLQQLILIVGSMRIVTLKAVAHGGRMHSALQRGRVLVRMAGDAKCLWRRSDELDTGDVFVNTHFMAGQAAHRDGGMDGFALRLVLMAFEALGGVNVLI
jgi:hypothetical protein